MKKKSLFQLFFKKKKKKTAGLLNFKYSVLPIGYKDLLAIWNCTEKTIHLREVWGKFLKNAKDCYLICQRKIEYVIKN